MGTLSVDKLMKTSTGAAEFTLPATDGTANQVMQTDGSGQLSLANYTGPIATDAVDSAQIAALAVDTAEIAANAVDGTKIAMGSDAAGDILTYTGTDYVRLAKGTAGQVLKMNSGATAVEWAAATEVKVGEFNYIIDTASGTQAITGVGFQPIALWIFAGPDRGITPPPVWGGSDGTTHGNVASIHATAANLWDANTSFLIDIETAAGVTATAVLTSFDSDGFTLTWTRTGATPTQTILINYWAVR